MYFNYTCYGLTLSSEFELPFVPIHYLQTSDVKIHSRLNRITGHSKVIIIKGIAHYWIQNGNEIIVERDKNTDQDSLVTLLIGSALPHLLAQRGLLILRGVVFALDGKAHLLLGASGLGKSTVLAELCFQGAKMLSDQFAVISLQQNNQLQVNSSFPLIKLWKDMTKKLGIHNLDLKPVRPNIHRFYWNANQYFCPMPLPIHSVFLLTREKLAKNMIYNPINGLDKINQVSQFLFPKPLLKVSDIQKKQAPLVLYLANQCPFFSVVRPTLDGTYIDLANPILERISI